MTTRRATGDPSAALAQEGLRRLGAHRSTQRRLNVQCRHGHHLAALYETEAGLVYQSVSGPHSHGSRDFVDTPHHGGERNEYVVLLDPSAQASAGDDLPAWCDCGPVTLSRAALLAEVRAGRHTVHVPETGLD